MRTRESRQTKRIVDELNSWPHTYAIKIHGSQYSKRGTPDILWTTHGRAFVIEDKIKPNIPTKLQVTELNKWAAAGAASTWVQTFDQAIAFVDKLRKSPRLTPEG